jgi:hypothetical protein
LHNKKILIYPEQGLGDFIQMSRFLPLISNQAAELLVETPTALINLLKSLDCNIQLLEQGASLPDFDFHCPIMSLPLAFKTTLGNIPSDGPYLHADPDKQRAWKAKLGNKTRPRIGLVWSGSSLHKNDRNRSIPLRLLKPLLELPYEFHCLQKEIRPEDLTLLNQIGYLQTHSNDLHDFSETAALLVNLDLTISVDTSVAHLAGSLGKPLWILLPFAAEYRWMIDRIDSPWYPNARLFRQKTIGDWNTLIADLCSEILNLNFT